MKFENIPNTEGNMMRARVPGGWIVREILECAHIGNEKNEYITTGYDWRVALCFVPDPRHQWSGV
jgi:hypothetical protein